LLDDTFKQCYDVGSKEAPYIMVRARPLNGNNETLTSGPLELAFLDLQDPSYDLVDGDARLVLAGGPPGGARAKPLCGYPAFRASATPLGSQRKCVLDTLLLHKA